MKIKDNIIYFNNDQEFYDACVCPNVKLHQSENNTFYFDIDFTAFYKNAVNSGKVFVIKDENSIIYKHRAVHLRSVSAPVENLEPYYKELKKLNKIN